VDQQRPITSYPKASSAISGNVVKLSQPVVSVASVTLTTFHFWTMINRAKETTNMLSNVSIRTLFISGAVLGLLLVTACRLFTGKAAPSNGRIEGRALDEKQQPLAEVVIVITATTARESYPEIAPITNERGEFSFSGLPVGEYTLRASRDGYQAQTRKVMVEDGQAASAEFVLHR
jgi:hypothetical protein